jgi:nicotinate-nucleotide adenylyltransferase
LSDRIGIYAGTFDPVHAGHIAFALQSLGIADLDKVYFLPERRPRAKNHVEHFAHRSAMIKSAIKPHPKFKLLELVDISFSVDRTLPRLKAMFPSKQLVFIFGSDVAKNLQHWPNIEILFKETEIIIGLRNPDNKEDIKKLINNWQTVPKSVTMFKSFAPEVSSGKVRNALRSRSRAKGTLTSVERYSDHNWLYVSFN